MALLLYPLRYNDAAYERTLISFDGKYCIDVNQIPCCKYIHVLSSDTANFCNTVLFRRRIPSCVNSRNLSKIIGCITTRPIIIVSKLKTLFHLLYVVYISLTFQVLTQLQRQFRPRKMGYHKYSRYEKPRQEISRILKYTIFFVNFIFWVSSPFERNFFCVGLKISSRFTSIFLFRKKVSRQPK